MRHLSSDQFSGSLLGQEDAWAAEHLRNCPGCRADVANFREALGEFRGAVRGWSEHQAVATIQPREAETRSPPRHIGRWIGSHQLALALLVAAVCILASFVLPRQAGENAAGSDAVLLNRVDGQVSRTVPRSLEPLMKLVVQE